jgi:hypothetical protein
MEFRRDRSRRCREEDITRQTDRSLNWRRFKSRANGETERRGREGGREGVAKQDVTSAGSISSSLSVCSFFLRRGIQIRSIDPASRAACPEIAGGRCPRSGRRLGVYDMTVIIISTPNVPRGPLSRLIRQVWILSDSEGTAVVWSAGRKILFPICCLPLPSSVTAG